MIEVNMYYEDLLFNQKFSDQYQRQDYKENITNYKKQIKTSTNSESTKSVKTNNIEKLLI